MPYRSKGTIRFESVTDRRLIFVPDSDHLVKDGNREYAVFFNVGNTRINQGRIFALDANRKGVVVAFDTVFVDPPAAPVNQLVNQLMSSAAATRIGVEIRVADGVEFFMHDGTPAARNAAVDDVFVVVKLNDITLPAA